MVYIDENTVGSIAYGIQYGKLNKDTNWNDVVDKLVKVDNVGETEHEAIAITESVVALSQNLVITVDEIASEIKRLYNNPRELQLYMPILSRNRFSMMLKGFARGVSDKIIIQFNIDHDQQGNRFMKPDEMITKGYNDINTVLTEQEMGIRTHEWTGEDYAKYYRKIIEDEGKQCEIIYSNIYQCKTDNVLACRFHDYHLDLMGMSSNVKKHALIDVCNKNNGYSDERWSPYGLLGCNIISEEHETLKLFPKNGDEFCQKIQNAFKERHNRDVEVMIFGDGTFTDPVSWICELADPTVSPGCTPNLKNLSNSYDIKYKAILNDPKYKDFTKEQVDEEIKKLVQEVVNSKDIADNKSLGTTPRRVTDLMGSAADLITGSGSKGTPFVRFINYLKYIEEYKMKI